MSRLYDFQGYTVVNDKRESFDYVIPATAEAYVLSA